MSKTVDQKVVEMRFDNRHFEENVKTSMSTLDKLKQKLHLDGASKGLDNVSKSAKNCDLSPLGKAAETVGSRFSAMEVMGVTALANITNSAVNAGKQMIKSLTIDPVKTGFNEYELKMNSVQTIMASTGESLETVNGYLEELNKYSDQTIYSFSDMTQNIGKFTNAGVKLDDAVMAIKGISNEAAVSGANANEASRAMYNFAQALSAGYVKLIDWKSIENANMATVEFKQQLIDSAVAAGTLTKSADGMYETLGGKTLNATKNFNETLQDEWMTTEVLIGTLKKYADETTDIGSKAKRAATEVKTFSQMMDTLKESAQSGWARTFEIFFGDFYQAKELWSNIGDAVGGFIEKISSNRNNVLEGALGSKGTNFDSLIEKINKAGIATEDFQAKLKNVAKEHNLDLDSMIKEEGSFIKVLKSGKISTDLIIETLRKFNGVNVEAAESTGKVTDKLNELGTYTVKKGDCLIRIAKKYGTTWQELYELNKDIINDPNLIFPDQVLKLSKAQGDNVKVTKEQADALKDLAEQSKATGIPIADLIAELDKPTGRELLIESFANALEGMKTALKAVGDVWKEIFPPKSTAEKSAQLYGIIEAINKFSQKLKMSGETADKVKRTFKGLFAILDLISTFVGGAFKFAFKAINYILGLFDTDILSLTASIGDALVAFRDWAKTNSIFAKGLQLITSYLKPAAAGIKNWIDSLKNSENIGKDVVLGLAKGLLNGIKLIGEIIWNLGAMMIQRICEVLGIHSPSTVFFAIGGFAILGLILGMKNMAPNAWNAIKEFGSKCIEIIKGIDFGKVFAAAIGTGLTIGAYKLSDALQKFAGLADGAGELLSGVGEGVSSFLTDTGVGLKKTLKGVGKMLKGVGKYFSGAGFEKRAKGILKIAIAVAILAGSVMLLARVDSDNLWTAVKALAALAAVLLILAKAASKMNESSTTLFEGGKLSKVTAKRGMAKNMLAIAGSLLLLALAMQKLSTIEDPGKTIGLLLALVAGLGIVMFAFNKLMKGDVGANADKAGKMLLKFSIALFIMTFVIKQIGKLDGMVIFKGLAVIGALTLFAVGLIAVSWLAGEHADKAGKMLLKMSVALLIMTFVMNRISEMTPEGLAKGLIVIGALATFCAALIAVSWLTGDNAAKAGSMLLKVSVALLVLTFVINQISKLSAGEIIKGLVVIAALGMFCTALIAVSMFAGDNAVKAGAMLLMVAGAMMILTGVIFILGKIDTGALIKGVIAVGVMEILFASLIKATEKSKDCMKSLIVLTVAIAVLAGALVALSFIDPASLATAAGSLSAVIGVFALLVKATQYLQTGEKEWKRSLVMLAGLTLIVGALATIIGLLSLCDPTSVISSAVGISILLAMLAGSFKIISSSKGMSADKMKDTFIMLTAMCGVVLILGAVIGLLSLCNPDSAIESAISLSVLLLALSTAMLVVSKAGKASPGSVGALLLMGLVVAELAVILGVMSALNVEASIPSAIALSILLGAMAGVLVVLSVIGQMTASAFTGIGALLVLGLVVAELALILGVMSAMGIEASIPTAIALSILVMAMSAALIPLSLAGLLGPAAIVGVGVLAAVVAALGALIIGIGALMENCPKLEEFLNKGIPILEKIGYALGSFFGNIVGGFLSGITSGLPKIAMDLSMFMVLLAPFIAGAKTIDPTMMAGVKSIAEIILILTAANILEGLTSWLTGGSSMSDFAAQLIPFGNAMAEFSSIVSGNISEEAVTAAANAGKTMAEMAKTLPNSGGVVGFFTGENDMDVFGQQLVSFGACIVAFSAIVAGKVNEEAVTAAANAGKTMAEMAKTIPNTGGVVGFFTGENDMDVFGQQLVVFGTCIATFSGIVAGRVNEEAVTAAANAGKTMAEMQSTIPNTGGVVDFFTGGNSMDVFGVQIVAFGNAITEFSKTVSGNINEEAIIAAANAGKMMAEMQNTIPSTGGVVEFFTGGSSMDKFGKQIKSFGTAIKDFSKEVDGNVSPSAISAASSAGLKLAKMASSIPEDINIEKFGKQLKPFGEAIRKFSESMQDVSIDTLPKVGSAVKALMKELSGAGDSGVDGFTKAFKDSEKKVDNAISGMLRSAESGINKKETKSKFKSAGKSLAEGFADGISANSYMAAAKAKAMADAALAAAKKALKINSPSKVFRKIGSGVPEGFAMGIDKLGGMVRNSSLGMAEMAINGTKGAIARIADVVNSDIDTQPTIRPVLDLSEISNGARSINGMFGMRPSVGMLSNVGSISSMMNRQNGVNDDVISAIKDLGSVLGGRSGDSYTINGVTYDDGSNVADAVKTLVRAARVERRR